MKIPLQQWFLNNIPKDKMIYKKAMEEQVIFVEDVLPKFLALDGEFDTYLKIRESTFVINTHTSKSIELPVYKIEALS